MSENQSVEIDFILYFETQENVLKRQLPTLKKTHEAKWDDLGIVV